MEGRGAGGNIIPTRWVRRDIPYYYGDQARELFVGAAVLSLIAIPIWGNLLPFGIVTEVGSIILLVLLAGITSPESVLVNVINAAISAIGALLLESTAISLYAVDSVPLFVAREAAAIFLLFAFYLSVKTVRNMLSGRLGTPRSLLESKETKDAAGK